ncbi:MAG: TOBE domain-containing protein [Campylobacterota bacterium]|nr:TOBE domain-containing protein [Campylobacterota bacterium]
MKIDGRFWLTKNEQSFLGSGRIELLEQIDKTGSMNAAAKAMKMSYKAAWERVREMNNLANAPIIEKVTGGRGGGGTVLTKHAYELIKTFKRFEKLHREFIDRFAEAGDDPEHLARILSRMFLTTSARNQICCKVISIKEHGVNGLMTLKLSAGEKLLADITLKSIESMGLAVGCDAYAIIKSSDVKVVNKAPSGSNRLNILEGAIKKIESSDDNAEVTFSLKGGEELIGVITLKESKGLKENERAYAYVEPCHIILGA